MEALLRQQKDLEYKLSRSVENLKKAGYAKVTVDAVNARIEQLHDRWDRYQRNYETLIADHWETFEKTPYWTENSAPRVEEIYFDQREQFTAWKRKLQKPEADAPTANSTVIGADASRAGPPFRAPLPRIELPHFSGKYEDWPSFRDLFNAIVDKEASLADVEKFHYLRTSLEGEAETLVRNLPSTSENYQRAWELLIERYENKRLLVRSYLTAFTSTPKMKTESAADLRRILHAVNTTESSLEGIHRSITSSEDLFVHLTVEMLDTASRKEWEGSVSKSPNPPALPTLKQFLEQRLQTLEALQPPKPMPRSGKYNDNSRNDINASAKSHHAGKTERSKPRCTLCKREHLLMACDAYRRKSAAARREYAETSRLCLNCLGLHKSETCQSKRGCTVCGSKHHTTLHKAFQETPALSIATLSAPATSSSHTVQRTPPKLCSVLLATARIRLSDRYGNHHEARALVDQGSESSFVAETLMQRLKLPRSRTSTAVIGIGGQQSSAARGRTSLSIVPRTGKSPIVTSALILPTLSAYSGRKEAQQTQWSHLQGLDLADPNYADDDHVEVLLGADVYAVILRPGLRRRSAHEPIAQQTSLGWILSGPINNTEVPAARQSFQCVIAESLDKQVRQFWEQEELITERPNLTPEEEECEKHFLETHSRQSDGRYVVRLPITGEIPDLSDTRRIAEKRLISMGNRFTRDERFQTMYLDFMSQYHSLGHMTMVDPSSPTTPGRLCYLPHHGVLREASSSTKLRVVFDGSATISTGDSINRHLHAGPNLLPMLFDLLLRWRTHRIVLASDVEKMFRQVMIHPDDRDLQRVLWKHPQTGDMIEYQLNTVTYGHACAPYLACRSLRQLAKDEGATFPLGAQALLKDVYMDDTLTGAETPAEAEELLMQLRGLCKAGGFPLKKWSSNDPTVLRSVPEEDRQLQSRAWDPEVNHPTLGLRWHPSTDAFSYSVSIAEMADITKRLVLSQTARLFDPLGWLTPITIYAKILIQSLWLQGLGWDDPIPGHEANKWRDFHQDLPTIQEIRVPRLLLAGSNRLQGELHGFADASERAYAAVIYLRDSTLPDESRVRLVAAKSKVAPLRQVSLPRLELAALTLLAQLMKHIRTVLDMPQAAQHLWSDSTVALHWVRSHPVRWTTYVANRVSSIQTAVPDARWHHVPGKDNPADCASRGLFPRELRQHPLWWSGPHWLKDENSWPTSRLSDPEDEGIERRTTSLHAKGESSPPEPKLLTDYSSLQRLLRVTAYCCRWRNQTARSSPIVTVKEHQAALQRWLRITQSLSFREEISQLRKDSSIQARSTLLKLQPFIDKDGILRVGGRLKHSLLSYDEKHPIILPRSSHLTKLLVKDSHERTLHGGTQATLAHLRQLYWIPQGRTLVKTHILRCTRCVRWRAARSQQLMGDLPAPRVTPSRPFLHVGVDYAGPYMLRISKGRGLRRTKAFLAIFVCMATKATHLDIVSDYTADAFLAAFRRFTSRRGLCQAVYSDCGTTFVGADRQLRELLSARGVQEHGIAQWMASEQVKWEFNPPSAPHFGGLWESAVKSVKHHIRRVIGETALTFEEMSTLLAQIEACLNSRPLQPLTDDPDDLSALTPGHFLIGTALLAIPEPSLMDIPTNRLSRWQLLQYMRDHFWNRWSSEYLTTLQQRPKWQRKSDKYTVGRLCLIRGENLPPAKWPLARITEIHPGADGIVRVVTLKTANATFKRPIAKVVLLPTENVDLQTN